MDRRFVVTAASVAVGFSLLISGCSQAASTPTAAPAAPTKAAAAQPTAAATAAPTAAEAAKKVDFPAKGKAITISVGYPAGGANDVGARMLAPLMEKALGTPVQVVNKPGAGSQVAMTELAASKPDGYLIGQTVLAPVITAYLDPERKATFTRKSFQMLGNHYAFPIAISVSKDSPYKSIKDVMDDAKANPGKVKAGTTGVLSNNHVVGLQLMKLTGAKFSFVHFDGGAPELTALLGGHIDVAINPLTEVVGQFKNGQIRVLGITDKDEVAVLPGVKTLESQGYKVLLSAATGYALPANTPREIVDVLSVAFKKATSDAENTKKMEELGYVMKYLDPQQYDSYWADMETQIAPLMELAKD